MNNLVLVHIARHREWGEMIESYMIYCRGTTVQNENIKRFDNGGRCPIESGISDILSMKTTIDIIARQREWGEMIESYLIYCRGTTIQNKNIKRFDNGGRNLIVSGISDILSMKTTIDYQLRWKFTPITYIIQRLRELGRPLNS